MSEVLINNKVINNNTRTYMPKQFFQSKNTDSIF